MLGLWQDRPASDAIATAALADSLGYPRLWIGEMATYDAFALAVRVAAETRHIEIAVGPLAVSVRSPVAIAMGVASVTDLTGRPTHVGLGTSSPVVVERWHGRTRAGSAAALVDTAHRVRSLLGGAKDPESGFRLRLPATESEIAVAAFGDRAIQAAASAGDHLLLNMVTPEAVSDARGRLEAAGGQHVRVAAWLVAAIDPSAEDIAQIRSAVVGYLAAPGYGEMFTDAGFGDVVALARSGAHPREVLASIPDGFEEVVGLVGSARRVGELLDRYRDAGLDTACVVPVTGSGDFGRRALERVAELIVANGAD